MDFKDLVKNRFSCKNFSSRKPDKSLIENILEYGRCAPTAKNLQEHHIYVISEEKSLSLVDSLTPCRYGAPVVLLVAFNKENVFMFPGGKHNSGIEDATIVATHLMLGAANEGLDSCWVNYFDPDKASKILNLPENEEILMLLDLGYAAEGVVPLPNHTSRKEISETVTYL